MSPAIGRWRQRGTRLIPFTGVLALNRLVCVGIGAALLALSITLYRRRAPAGRAPRAVEAAARRAATVRTRRIPVASAGGAGIWAQFMSCVRQETRAILRSWSVSGPACAGGSWVHSRLGVRRRKLRHAVAADDAYRRQYADAGYLFVAAGPGGAVQHRDRMARAAGRHRRDRRCDTGAEALSSWPRNSSRSR